MSNSISRTRESESRLLQRILDTPQLAAAVPRLHPELLHRVIQHCGLEDCSELVALATPAQLTRVFDLDLWGAAHPGLDEHFDAARFGLWLQVLLEGGAELAAAKLADMAPDVVAAGLAQHLRVFDVGTAMPYYTLDGELMPGHADLEAPHSETGGYRLVARRTDAWDAVVEVLLSLERVHDARFHDLMRRCRAVSSSRPEENAMHDLLDDPEQAMFDLALDRERRREQQGYATPAQARAFLEMARRPAAHAAGAPDPIATAYFRALEEHARESAPARAALAAGTGGDGDAAGADEEGVAAIVEVLLDSGILEPEPSSRALPAGTAGEAPRLARVHAALQTVLDRDPALYALRSGELGYLANTLLSGCSIQGRAFTPSEASDAAVAICNLGLDTWPVAMPEDVLVAHDLVGVFRRGWSVLYERVSLPAARGLIDALARVRSHDRDTQVALNRLRAELRRHTKAGTPWRARRALEVIATLDLLAWAGLMGLLDECPVMHGAIAASRQAKATSVSATAFEFVSENAQILVVDAFVASLPQLFAS